MKRMFKRVLATVLTVVMLLTAAPLNGFVGLELPDFGTIFSTKAEAATNSGTCGDNLTWTFDESTGELTISGNGAMYDYNYDNRPWESYKYNIKSVIIGNSVTTIGDWTFYDCISLTSTIIPDCVTTIGFYTFGSCYGLTSVTIGNSVTTIGNQAFSSCDNLTSVAIGNSVTTIGDNAFYYCNNLTCVTIPDCVTTIGVYAFANCSSLTSVTIGNGVATIGEWAFYDSTSLSNVYYNGTENDWCVINIGKANDPLINATIHFLGGECSHLYTHMIVPSTCKIQGMEYDLCSVCGNTTNSNVLPLAEHAWGGWTVIREADVENAGLEQHTCSVCGDVESRAIPKLEVIKDDETGVEIVYGNEYESGVEVEVTPVYDGNSYQIIESNYGNVNSKIFDISTVKDGQKVQPNGKVKVRIPVPADFTSNNIFVCYVDSVNGTVENIPATIKNGYIEFEAEHFSYYAIMEKLGKVNSVDIADIEMNYKDSTTITPDISIDEGVEYTVAYSSSNPDVAYVDENGEVYASGKGSAEITCTVTDEYGNIVTDTCDVEVKYSFGQWLIIILLFGWIWY